MKSIKSIAEESFNPINENIKARAPKLRGKALKKRQNKAEVLKELQNDQQLKSMIDNLLKVAKVKIKNIASSKGINPKMVDITEIKFK